MGSRFSLILIACVVIFGGILFFSKKDAEAPKNSDGSTVQASNHTKGEGKKKVTLTEYGDFQCPACAGFYPIVEEVVEKYKEDITFQFRSFPLRSIHPNAMAAHRAAEAASVQNKFWEMYNQLYQTQTSWSNLPDATSTFRTYAQGLGLDMTKYDADVKSEASNLIVNADLAEGQKLGITSTPTFLINGKKIENPKDAAAFEKLIKDAIEASDN
jgi:protein-disulfide isomerase